MIDPCPVCAMPIQKLNPSYTEPVTEYGILDLGWRVVDISWSHMVQLTHWTLDPCGHVLLGTDWNILNIPREPIHWVHPDEIESFINDRRDTNTT